VYQQSARDELNWMITVLDRIVLEATQLPEVERLFRECYEPAAAERGLRLVSREISPPLMLAEAPLTLWQRWEVADVGAWWNMRAQSGTPSVAEFWQRIDALTISRERVYPGAHTASELPAPIGNASDVASRGYRETAQLRVREGSIDTLDAGLREVMALLPGAEHTALARNFAPEYAAGHLTWDLLYPDASTAGEAQKSTVWRQHIAPLLDQHCDAIHALAMDTVGAGLRAPGIANGVKRTAFFRLQPGVDADTAARFERDLLAMPLYIPEIRNWRLSRASAAGWHRADATDWTWVWEQEFNDLDGLTGPYMIHPHHWAHIDRWFDPESGDQAIDVNLSHAFSAFGESLLALELIPPGINGLCNQAR